MCEDVNFKLKTHYNVHNWYTGVVHACTPKWEQWSDVPEEKKDLRAPQSSFYKTLCGSDSIYHMNLTSKREVTCMKCLKIMKQEIDKQKLTQKTTVFFRNKYYDVPGMGRLGDIPFGSKQKRRAVFKQL